MATRSYLASRPEVAFDDAILKGRRQRGQTPTTLLTTKKAAFAELKRQGLDLLATSPGRHLLGHLILRHALSLRINARD